jgi:hypothetical protein
MIGLFVFLVYFAFPASESLPVEPHMVIIHT